MIKKPGIYEITAEEYHADPCIEPSLSSSIAKIICTKTAAHASLAHPLLTPQDPKDPSPAMDLGTAVHALVLQPEIAEDLIVVVEEATWRTKLAKEQRSGARADGRVPLLSHVFDTAVEMSEAARLQIGQHPADIFEAGKCEQTMVWKEEDIWCRSRVDWLRSDHRYIDDFKTTAAGCSPHDISRRVFADGWDVQAAFYLRGLEAIGATEYVPHFRFAVLESTPPYSLVVVELNADALMLAERKVAHAINTWRECMETGIWEGYPQKSFWVSLPPWEENRWLETEDLFQVPIESLMKPKL